MLADPGPARKGVLSASALRYTQPVRFRCPGRPLIAVDRAGIMVAKAQEIPVADQATPTLKHRRVAFRLEFSHLLTRERDEDLYFGDYADAKGHRIGQLIHARHNPESTHAVLIPDEDVPLMHIESSLDADHAVASYDMVIALVYEPSEKVPSGVDETGDLWDAGPIRVYLFEDDEAAALARSLS